MFSFHRLRVYRTKIIVDLPRPWQWRLARLSSRRWRKSRRVEIVSYPTEIVHRAVLFQDDADPRDGR